MSEKTSMVEKFRQELTLPDSSDAQTARKGATSTSGFAIFLTVACAVTIPAIIGSLNKAPAHLPDVMEALNFITDFVSLLMEIGLALLAVRYWSMTLGWLLLHKEAVARHDYAPTPASTEDH